MNLKFLFYCLVSFLLSCKNEKQKPRSSTKLDTDSLFQRLKQLPDSLKTRIEIQPSIFVYDTLKSGDRLSGNFIIKNKGNSQLKIEKISSVCNCTVSKAYKNLIAPNDTTVIHFEINTKSFSEGFNQNFITLYGNFHPSIRSLQIEGYIKD